MLKNLKIGTKLIGAFGLVAIICGVVGFIGYFAIGKTTDSITEISDVRLPSISSLMVIKDASSVIEGSIKSLCNPALTEQDIQAEFDKIAGVREEYEQAWKIYEPLPQTEREAQVWKEFVKAWDHWRDENDKFMDMQHQLTAVGIHNPTKFRQQVEMFTKDHHALMSSLATSILEGKDFHGQTDPSKCAFGKWLASFHTDNQKLKNYLHEIHEHHDDFHHKAGEVARILRQSKGQDAIDRADRIYVNEVMPAAEETFAIFDELNKEVATAEELLHNMQKQAMEVNAQAAAEAIALLDEIVEINENVAAESATTGKKTASSMNTIIIISLILGAGFAFGVGYFISKSLSKPLVKISHIAGEIAKGDINQQVDLYSKDETGQLADSFRELIDYMHNMADVATHIADGDLTVNIEAKSHRDVLGTAFARMSGNLEQIVRDLTDNTTQLVSAASEIASASEQMSAGATQQTGQANQAATAVEEMTATIVQSSKNSSEASDLARSASDSANEGTGIVSQTIEGMNRISSVVSSSADTIQKLAKSADQIGDIISVIDDIADQTNLLALNAAIEAARAGEQGRGFAVVADEVRKLAERTGKATGEIAEMIKGIQSETNGAVSSMEQGLGEVNSGRELADKAGNSLSDILQKSQSVMDMIQQIATAAEEQSAASEEISKNVANIAAVTKQTAAGAEQSASAAEQLNRQAENLRGMVGKFKVRGGNLGIIDLAKTDHMHYVKNLEDVLENRKDAGRWKEVDHRNCRFGKWYISEGIKEYGEMPAFKAVDDPHRKVHDYANQAIKAYQSGDRDRAEKLMNQSVQASHDVIEDLDKLKNELLAHA